MLTTSGQLTHTYASRVWDPIIQTVSVSSFPVVVLEFAKMKIAQDWEQLVLGMFRSRIVKNAKWLTICLDLMEDLRPQILQSINIWLTSTKPDRLQMRGPPRILHLIARVPPKESKQFCKSGTERTLSEHALMYLYATLVQVSLTVHQHTIIFSILKCIFSISV